MYEIINLSQELHLFYMNRSKTNKCSLRMSVKKRLPLKNSPKAGVRVTIRSICDKKEVTVKML